MEDVCIFSVYLSTLRPFDIFFGHLVIFPRFWFIVPKKIWQPSCVGLSMILSVGGARQTEADIEKRGRQTEHRTGWQTDWIRLCRQQKLWKHDAKVAFVRQDWYASPMYVFRLSVDISWFWLPGSGFCGENLEWKERSEKRFDKKKLWSVEIDDFVTCVCAPSLPAPKTVLNFSVRTFFHSNFSTYYWTIVCFCFFYTTTLYPGGIRPHNQSPVYSVAGGDYTSRPRHKGTIVCFYISRVNQSLFSLNCVKMFQRQNASMIFKDI
jgi:hypothetical protein